MLDFRSGLNAFTGLRSIWRWTRGKFASQPQWRAFVTWQAYYEAFLRTDADRALLRHTGPYVANSTHQIELIKGLMTGSGPAIVHAPPGCGKSRFALELARRVEREHPRWQVLFVRHEETAVREELPQLMQLEHAVFILDDAHECPELVQLLAAASAQTSATAHVHLVCLTRSTRRAAVSAALNGAFPPGTLHEVDLDRPSLQLVRTLIDQLLPQSSPHHRDTIARFARQSYFGAALVCGMLRREVKLPQTFQRHDLRDRVRRETLQAAIDGVCPIETALRALAVYAALAPVVKARTDVQEWAAQLSGLAPDAVAALIERVLRAGLFQPYGDGLIRPMPDLLGDLLLEEACLDVQGKPTPFSTQLLAALLEAEPAVSVRNCADVGQLFGAAEGVDLVSELLLERARAIPVGNQWDALELLRTTQPLAARRPATVIELARILEARGILRRAPPTAGLSATDSFEMALCALLMSAGEVDSTAVPVALGLGRDLYAATREDARSREYVLGQLAAYCRLGQDRSPGPARAIVDTLHAWIGESEVEAAALSASLTAQFLTLDVGRNPVPGLVAVRDVAIDTLTRGMTHGEVTVQCAAIGALERYIDGGATPERMGSDRWLPRWAAETDRLSTALIKLAQESSRLPVSAAAERLGWHWWGRQEDVLHRAGAAILRAIPDTDAYRLWKLLYAPQLPVRTVPPESTPRPEDRRQHVHALSTARAQDTLEQTRGLFDTLDPRYADSGAWHALWLVVLEQSALVPDHPPIDVVVGEFARRHAEAAWSFVNPADAEGPLLAMLPFLLVELGKRDRARRSAESRKVPSGTRLEEAWLRALSLTSDFDEPERALLARGLESADSDTVHRAADALLAAGGADRLAAFRRVFGVIAHRPTDSGLWELAIHRFVSWAEVVLPPRLDEPTDEMTQAANGLVSLLRNHGSELRWGFQQHTRELAHALAIVAVLSPTRMQEWMLRDWVQLETPGGKWSDESPLTAGRLPQMMRRIADSPAAGQWIETFLTWMKRSPQLASLGALGLAELCSLDDPRVDELTRAIGARPTDPSQKALAEFVNHRKKRERPRQGLGAPD